MSMISPFAELNFDPEGSDVKIVGGLKQINNRTSSMSCDSFGIIDWS